MPNLFWYILLLGFSILVYAAGSRKEPALFLPLWLFNSGLSYLFELIVYVVFNCYTYKPEVFDDSFTDSTFGSIFSQGMSVPVAAAFCSVFRIRLTGVLLFSLFFSSVEIWFLHMDIYEHTWWRTSYTFLLIPVLFYLSRFWYSLLQKRKPAVLLLTHLFSMITISITVTWLLYVINPVIVFKTGWFEEASRDHTFVNALYSIVSSLLYTAAAYLSRMIYKGCCLAALIVLDLILIMQGTLQMKSNEDLFFLLLMHFFFLAAAVLFKRFLQKGSMVISGEMHQ
ncbi:hypothetical protein GKZ89_12965 [Bacillus mangrovi]|uniref:Uncharacterized protein n=1 Tax=Metabacillus mangrovi TaxID=1491830 RepID=A0A7X2V5C6_9BACI|nr:hypothetical protein [Metabacillus mangrovi]MTH54315.1 hypothetical protein [Metabacillus mangrovi]